MQRPSKAGTIETWRKSSTYNMTVTTFIKTRHGPKASLLLKFYFGSKCVSGPYLYYRPYARSFAHSWTVSFGKWHSRLFASLSPRLSWRVSLLRHQLWPSPTRRSHDRRGSERERCLQRWVCRSGHSLQLRPPISTTGVAVHTRYIVKTVMVEMAPLFERTIKAAVATAIEAMLPQLEASIVAENKRLSKEVGDMRSALQ